MNQQNMNKKIEILNSLLEITAYTVLQFFCYHLENILGQHAVDSSFCNMVHTSSKFN